MSASKITAANRFGLGARPGEIDGDGDGREILLAQLQRPLAASEFDGLPSSAATMRNEYEMQRLGREADAAGKSQANGADTSGMSDARALPASTGADAATGPAADKRRDLRKQQIQEFAARYRHAARTPAPFVERLTQFWSNHFAVSIDKSSASRYAASMEREAIRPHVTGRFEDMLFAVETHPAMLRYLDNTVSIGDASRAAQKAEQTQKRKRGLNENLAREILELHTLGVDGGYHQQDVTELAKAITGWSTLGPKEKDQSEDPFAFRANAHEPGARHVLGRDYAEGGLEQGRAVLSDLARHPATARHLSFKLARHFVADEPPAALVEAMTKAYLRSDGDLRALYTSLVESPLAWKPDARKFKTPNDFVISALRAGELPVDDDARALVALLAGLGQPIFTPRSPAGFPDTTADWSSPDGLFKRIQAAQLFAARVDANGSTPYQRALSVLGNETVSGDFAIGLRRAGSASDGYSLLFASPQFQWRA